MDSIISTWHFQTETTAPSELLELLVNGEEPHKAYKTVRDTALFTNKRLIVMDSQGLTGKKKEIYSLPYKSITMWSTENSGTFDMNSEVQLWTRAGTFKIGLGRSIDVRQFESLLAREVL